MTQASTYDIREYQGVATLLLPDTDAVIGSVQRNDRVWVATALDYVPLRAGGSRAEAADIVFADWQCRFEGAPVCSPTSAMALARELHRLRGHRSPVRRQVNWLCQCNSDARMVNGTRWLRGVVETLGGTFPKERPGG